ncbi:transposase [Stenotrophomonas sp. C3(2023)]|uniref:REP-associated tyrosine transposase n=1 Tax=Stenotrophomonas sp. C3(2023) TaxID=3080277 RepID=UPI00293D16B0|nr:transposase [Stenotrophomonas sp. C3(2023)]MDV3468400.1 transposase [Stenotrophomonas sp. C3(2023)]
MASPALQRGRFSSIGCCYVVTTVTHKRHRHLADPRAATELQHWIAHADTQDLTRTHAWVIMPDHLHWMFTLRTGALEQAVRTVKSRTAKAINQRCGLHGAFWQAGYYDQLQRDERQWRQQALYIVNNPVRAGLVSALNDYPYLWCRWTP